MLAMAVLTRLIISRIEVITLLLFLKPIDILMAIEALSIGNPFKGFVTLIA